MTLPKPSPDSLALVTGASSGIGEQFASAPNRRLPRWLVLPISKRLMARQ